MLTLSLSFCITASKDGAQITATVASTGRLTYQAHVSRFTLGECEIGESESRLEKDLGATLSRQRSQHLKKQLGRILCSLKGSLKCTCFFVALQCACIDYQP